MMESVPELSVLALNSGSSSLKFGLYRAGPARAEMLLCGEAELIGNNGRLRARDARGRALLSETVSGQQEAVARIAKLLADSGMPAVDAIGHRVVHGGPQLRRHCVIDDLALIKLQAAAAFAPLHVPLTLSIIRFAQEYFPGMTQVACFDTAFHSGMAEVARVLPISRELQSRGIQRYGFHGLSCESIVQQLAHDLPQRLVIAHLGNGASITAIKTGKSIDTSMGLTPSGGVMMGTRSGDLDPGVLIYLLREMKFDGAGLEELIDHHSGLLGISGVASDMRRLHEAAPLNPDARLAIQMYCYSVRKQIAAMIAALEGIDMLVFTGGIGENDWEIRDAICSGLSWAGVRLDEDRNYQSAHGTISEAASPCTVRVLVSQEDEQIARHTWTLFPRDRLSTVNEAR